MSLFDNITNPFEDKEVIRKIIDIYCNARVDNETKEIYDADGLYKRITDYGKETENSQNEYISKFDRYIRLPNLDKLYANIGLEDFEAFDKQVEEIQRGIESRPISDTEKQGMIRELHKKTMYPLSRFKMLFDEFNSFSDIEKIYNEKRFAYIENILIYLDIYPSHKEEYMQQLQEFGLTEEEQIQKIDILTIFRRKMNNRFYGGEGVMGFHVNPQSLQVYDTEENVEKGEMKLYINAGTDTYKFASLFQERCEELGLNYYFKVAHAYEEAEYKRNDKMCIFTERKDAEKFLEVIQQVKEENPDIILKSSPLLAGKIEGNIGVGMDNISSKGKSYNQEMSTICFETIKQFFKGMPREQIPEYIKANPQVIEQLQSEMIAKVQNTGLSELFQKKKTKGQGEQTTDLEDLLTERLEESSTESLEELSTEKLEELLRTTQEQNKSKKSELEQLLKKQMLIEKIIQAQEEGKQLDRQIAEARAKLAGVKNYGKFNNYGYRGLYNGETAKDIANRKGISEKEDILDYMSSTELAANLFRITQTDEVLKNKNIHNEDDACITHHNVGQAVRQTIKRIGGTMPEDLPTPSKSAKQIEQEKQNELKSNDKKKLK